MNMRVTLKNWRKMGRAILGVLRCKTIMMIFQVRMVRDELEQLLYDDDDMVVRLTGLMCMAVFIAVLGYVHYRAPMSLHILVSALGLVPTVHADTSIDTEIGSRFANLILSAVL
ncbi:unnamed protein product [Sphagnum troendelagicum]|uniref:Uncharacterized protein n=1 Tax=Sphagnum troendelagicum TaxID=128251 RepID=A0ABP0ULJ4_9BRYO